MSGAMQSLGQFGSKVGSDPSGAFGTLGSDAWSGLTQPQQGGSMSELQGLIKGVGPYAGGLSDFLGGQEQQSIYNKLRNPTWGQIPAQAQQNILNTVQGQIGPSVGSAEPIKLAQGVANADYGAQLAAQQNYLSSLANAARMGQQPGSLQQMIAALTGGLGGQYATSTGTSPTTGNIDPSTGYPAPYTGDPSGYQAGIGFGPSAFGPFGTP